MLNPKITDLLNKQINKELHSAYVYAGIANYYDEKGLGGFTTWFDQQTKEEMEHAELIISYIRDNGERIVFETIEKPVLNFKNNKEPLDLALEHERYITKSINEIYETAFDLKDFRTMEYLNWFIKEQLEEEKNAQELCDRFELFGQEAKGLYMLNKELGTRQEGSVQ